MLACLVKIGRFLAAFKGPQVLSKMQSCFMENAALEILVLQVGGCTLPELDSIALLLTGQLDMWVQG